MPISYIYTGDPTNGTGDDDFIFPMIAFAGTNSNSINAGGGDDLVIGDSRQILTPGLSQNNSSIGAAFSLEVANAWILGENPMFGNESIPHVTAICEATIGQTEFYSVNVGSGQTLTVDIDFGDSVIGVSEDLEIFVRDASGTVLSSSAWSLATDGGLGSRPGTPGNPQSNDPYLNLVVPAGGTYYIEVTRAGGAAFTTNATYVLNVSVTGHSTSAPVAGLDVINGGDGDDVLFGQYSNDTLIGGSGADTLHGGSADDLLEGGTGADILIGGDGFDTASYANSAQQVTVLMWDDHAVGGDATGDTLTSIESLVGSAFNDELAGMDNRSDTLRGGAGHDSLGGMSGDDVLFGNDGDDLLTGGAGVDTLTGGAGADHFFWSAGTDSPQGGATWDHVTDFTSGEDVLHFSGEQGLLNVWTQDGFTYIAFARPIGGSFEGMIRITGTVQGSDIITDGTGVRIDGTDAADEIIGGAGNDSLHGFAEQDTLRGGAGDDFLFGGDARDNLYGGEGDDTLDGEAGNDVFYSGLGSDAFRGGEGYDTVAYEFDLIGAASGISFDASSMSGGSGQLADGQGGLDTLVSIEQLSIFGTSFDDVLTGSAGIDHLFGGAGIDTLTGGGGDDCLYGQAGPDQLFGGDGLDVLSGGDGADYLHGGSGADTFSWSSSTESPTGGSFDAVADFETGVDQLAFYLVDNNGPIVTPVFIQRSGSSSFVYFDQQPGGAFDGIVQVVGTVQGSDITGQIGTTYLYGQDGVADDLRGGSRGDVIVGFSGDDIITGGDGSDALYGGAGADRFVYTAVNDSNLSAYDGIGDFTSGSDKLDLSAIVSAGHTNLALARFGGSTFVYFGQPGQPNFSGLVIAADAVQASDLILGQTLGIVFYGSSDADVLRGGAGADTFLGGDGADVIVGGNGADSLFGGAGADVFDYNTANHSTATAWDTIQDFQVGIDKIDLRGVTGQVTLSTFNGATFVNFNPNGSGGFDGLIIANGVTLTQDDILVTGESAPGLDTKDEGPLTLPPLGDDDPLILPVGFEGKAEAVIDHLDPLILPRGFEGKIDEDHAPEICPPGDGFGTGAVSPHSFDDSFRLALIEDIRTGLHVGQAGGWSWAF